MIQNTIMKILDKNLNVKEETYNPTIRRNIENDER